MVKKKYISWYIQAASDYRTVEGLIGLKMYSQACFYAQQVAEKCLKALAYYRGADLVKSHSLVQILSDLKINGELERAGRERGTGRKIASGRNKSMDTIR